MTIDQRIDAIRKLNEKVRDPQLPAYQFQERMSDALDEITICMQAIWDEVTKL